MSCLNDWWNSPMEWSEPGIIFVRKFCKQMQITLIEDYFDFLFHVCPFVSYVFQGTCPFHLSYWIYCYNVYIIPIIILISIRSVMIVAPSFQMLVVFLLCFYSHHIFFSLFVPCSLSLFPLLSLCLQSENPIKMSSFIRVWLIFQNLNI